MRPHDIKTLIKNFRNKLKLFCESHGTSVAAKQCAVTDRSIRLWLTGKSVPNLVTKIGVLALLECYAPPKRMKGGAVL